MRDKPAHIAAYEVILGNANPRFSGVTSTMLQTLPYQITLMNIGILGAHNIPPTLSDRTVSFWQLVKYLRDPLPDGRARIFHARRNNEMIQALLLKHLFGLKLKILFTSTAQRHHTRFTRWLMSRVDCIISTCQAAANYLEHPPAAIIPHGIRTDIYFPEEKNAASNSIKVGIFGRVRKQKGTALFVDAILALMPKYPELEAIIVGAVTPEQRGFAEELKTRIEASGFASRIRILGEQPFEQLPNLFRSVDIVTALSESEGFGLTVLEAMSSGAAVIATRAGAWPDIIEEGRQGFVIPVNDKASLTARLEELIRHPERMHIMGRTGRQLVLERYRIESEARQLCDIYKQLMI